jgi:glycosyltransferase involved in cell wall biosynthesis
MNKRVVMACYFYPRGGSAQVIRYLASRLRKSLSIHLYTGSLGEAGALTNASTFYAGMDPIQLDYTKADLEWQKGGYPMLADPPMQGSFEDRPGVADVFLAKLSPELARRQVLAWRQLLSLEEKEPDIVHLHHLTPMHYAAFDLWSNATVVTHLHGTELKMIETIRETRGLKFGDWWIDQMRTSADRSRLLITVSLQDRDLALDLLSVPTSKVVTIPNGVDVDLFRPRNLSDDERTSHWRRWLVTDPQGWVPNGSPASVTYSDADLGTFRNVDGSLAPILLFVGRFTAFKRIDVLLDAFEMFRANSEYTAPL